MRLIGSPVEPTRQAQAMAAAEQMVLAEIAREASLAEPTDKKIDVAIKTEKAARAALDALGIDKPTDKAPMTMADALQARGYSPPAYDDDDETDVDANNETTTDDSGASA